jgi:hypothetical protein
MIKGHVYGVYVTTKVFLFGAVLAYLALTLAPTINNHYNKSICAQCNDQAAAHKTIPYEFSACGSITPAANGPNLLKESWIDLVASPVPEYLYNAIAVCTLALVMSVLLACFWAGDTVLNISGLTFANTLFTVSFIAFGDSLMQLYLKDNCYISVWGLDYMLARSIMQLVVSGPVIIYILLHFSGFKESVVANGCLILGLVGILGCTVCSVWLAVMNLRTTGNWIHIVLSSVGVASMLDGLVLYYKWGSLPSEYHQHIDKHNITEQQKAASFDDGLHA